MMNTVLVKSFEPPVLCKKEILRYSGCKQSEEEIDALIEQCLTEAEDKLSYKVCYTFVDLELLGNECKIGKCSFISNGLSANLNGCKGVLVFGATLGTGLDRLISKYSRISPSKALMLQAIGAERIEALCDAFCDFVEKEYKIYLKPRYSPGYGDLPLAVQTYIFELLNCPGKIGLTLSDSMVMSPSKSVTAIAGVTESIQRKNIDKCSRCEKKDCCYRGII